MVTKVSESKRKVAITGSRKPALDYQQWKEKYSAIILSFNPIVIISGGASGIDAYAAQLSKDLNIPLLEFKPDYKTYGRGAPLQRNTLIVENSDVVIAFPSESSKGTYDTIRKAKQLNKTVRVCRLLK